MTSRVFKMDTIGARRKSKIAVMFINDLLLVDLNVREECRGLESHAS